jgi:CheY-like chemotaxis protein
MEGNLGFELARQHRPDVILLDLHLPGIDGEVVLKKLKDEPGTKAIPVIVVSADATAARVERLLALGADEFMTKPLDVRRFLELFDQIVSERMAA